MARKKLLNIRAHLDHVATCLDGFMEYGDCPAVRDDVVKLRLMNRAIIRKHDASKAKGNRKDIRS